MPTTELGPEHRLQATNLTLLLSALRALRVARVEVTYAGVRGRCHSCDVSITPADALRELRQSRVVQYRLAADAGQRPIAHLSETVCLADALKHFALHWASLQHGHWQRGDGGKGVMRIDVSKGQLRRPCASALLQFYRLSTAAADSRSEPP